MTHKNAIPPTWALCRLGEIVEIQVGNPFKSEFYESSGVRLLRGDNVAPGKLEWSEFKCWPAERMEGLHTYMVAVGDVILAMDRPVISSGLKIATVTSEDMPCLLVQRVARIRSSIGPNQYVRYAISRLEFLRHISNRQTGTMLPHISAGTIKDFIVPIAPLREQRRIVAEIEKQFTRLDAAEASLERVKANLRRARASVLQAAVEGRLVPTEASLARAEGRDYEPASVLLARILDERKSKWPAKKHSNLIFPPAKGATHYPAGWTSATVDQLAVVGTGATPKRGAVEYWKDGTIPWITSAATNAPQIDEAAEFVTARALAETNLTIYPTGTLMLAMYGEGKTRGMCAIARFETTTNQALAAIVTTALPAETKEWLRVFFAHNYDAIRRASSGGVQPNLNVGIIRSIVLPLPPLAEQHRIVAEVERRLTILDSLAATVERRLESCKHLRQSILKRAFEGKLIPQDPNDEPASALLARLPKPAKPTKGRKSS